jgi:hypothetical protein
MCRIDACKLQQKSSSSVLKGGKLLQVRGLMDDVIYEKGTNHDAFKDN